jgi:hypothetical protein
MAFMDMPQMAAAAIAALMIRRIGCFPRLWLRYAGGSLGHVLNSTNSLKWA